MMGDGDKEKDANQLSAELSSTRDPSAGPSGGLRSGKDPKNPHADLALQIQVSQIQRSLRGKKSHRSRHYHALEAIAKGIGPSNASPYVIPELKEELKKVQGFVTDITDLYYEWIHLEPERNDELLAEVQSNNDVSQDASALALTFLNEVPVPDAPDSGAAPQPARPDLGHGSRQVKANSALKPDDLTLEHSPVELTHWQQRFRAYYRTSNMDLLPPNDQKEYLNASLDHTVQGLLDARIVPGAAILEGPGSCFEVLRTLWLERYPLFQRRHQFFTIDFKGALTDLPQFMSKLEELAKSAEVQDLDASTLTAYKALSCVEDTELRRLCWREETLTLTKFRQLVIQRVREAENLQGIKKNQAFVNYASDKRKSTNQSGRCHNCGQLGHWQAECPKNRQGPPGGGRGHRWPPPNQRPGQARAAEEEPEDAYLARGKHYFSRSRGGKRGGGRGKPSGRGRGGGGGGGGRSHARQAAEAPAQAQQQQQPASGTGQATSENAPEKHESAFIVKEEEE